MNGNLYRVEFRTSVPQFIYAQDAVSAKNEAASNLSAIVRPATSGEMLEWISVEIEKMQITVSQIEKEFRADCE
jgi:hypothetical protein